MNFSEIAYKHLLSSSVPLFVRGDLANQILKRPLSRVRVGLWSNRHVDNHGRVQGGSGRKKWGEKKSEKRDSLEIEMGYCTVF